MTLSHLLGMILATNGCDLQQTVAEAVMHDGAVAMAGVREEIAIAADHALALDPEVSCADRTRLVRSVVDSWLRDGKVLVERPDQVSDFIVRPFGKLQIQVAEPVSELTIRTAGQSVHLENGRKLVLAAGPAKVDVYSGSRLICSIAHVVKADQVETLTCPSPRRKGERGG